ncbi:N-acetylmuramoyl-L-alanine amidase [Priestia koreensis]|uniref:N-acetylmuramoyl-L-alanine amidase n=1 Tax=Priestia koreensis TaxID=284581 RepID=UPI0028F6C9FD|nr:N-acetylmuramoyl-L-alanine amidase [Priestia koreensis]
MNKRKQLVICLFFCIITLFLTSYDRQDVPVLESGSVTADVLNMRKGPGLSFPVVRKLHHGKEVAILVEQGEWRYVRLQDGAEGWISSRYVRTTANQALPVQAAVQQTSNEEKLNGKVIVIDPGHGGKDKGATGSQGTFEKDLTLRTATQLKEQLEQTGATVLLTRTSDTRIALSSRVQYAREHRADVFISIHYNSVKDESAHGIMTYFYQEKKDRSLAQSIQKQLAHTSKLKNKYDKFGNFYVLRENPQPSVLVELGFLSNREEEQYINSIAFQRDVVGGITQGITQYLLQK